VTSSVPGAGLSWSHYSPHAQRRPAKLPAEQPFVSPANLQDHAQPLGHAPLNDGSVRTFESASVEKIASLSTSELALILNAAHKRIRLFWLAFVVSVLSAVAVVQGNAALLPYAFGFGILVTCGAALLDRYRRSVKIDFKFEGLAGNVTTALLGSFDDLKSCRSVWNVTVEQSTSDWKRNAGATTLNTRSAISPALSRPQCIRSTSAFPHLSAGKINLFFFPDGILVVTRSSVTALTYADISASSRAVRFIESEAVPADSTVVDHTWLYVNKNGGPDRRFNGNRQLPVCLYGELDLQSGGGLNARIQYSKADAGERLVKVIDLLRQLGAKKGRIDTAVSFHQPRSLPTAIFCSVLLGGGLLLTLLSLSMPQSLVVEKPAQSTADQPAVSAIPLPKPRPMGGPLIEGSSTKQSRPSSDNAKTLSVGQPLSINPLDSQSVPKTRAQ